jgi:hypothetical protein
MSDEQNTILNIPNYNSKRAVNTNNISDVQDNDKLKSKRDNYYYDINKDDANETEHIQTELTSMNTSSSTLNEDEILDKEINQANKLNSPIIKEEANNIYGGSLLYGNSINDLTPRRIGNMYAFLYINQKPLIVIGPDCKKYIHLFLFR